MTDSNRNNDDTGDYPYANSKATRLLSDAITRMAETKQASLRQLAGKLKYKSAVVLSHMRTGRLPIPIDRAMEIARITQLDGPTFLLAVLAQRYPDVNFADAISEHSEKGVSSGKSAEAGFLADLERAAARPLSDLSREQLGVVREVVSTPHPRSRWISTNEMSVIEKVRALYPDVARDGLDLDEELKIVKIERAPKDAPDDRAMF